MSRCQEKTADREAIDKEGEKGANNIQKVQLICMIYSCLYGGLYYTRTDWWPVQSIAYLSGYQSWRMRAGSLT